MVFAQFQFPHLFQQEIYQQFQPLIRTKIEKRLHALDDFICFNQSWFLADMLVPVQEGLLNIVPYERLEFARQIAAQGAVMSETSPLARPNTAMPRANIIPNCGASSAQPLPFRMTPRTITR